jgi:hypothetical protein
MKHVMVRYRVKSDRVAENKEYILAVFSELARERPTGLEYASFELDDASFMHIASLASSENPLLALQSFQAFTARIRERCEEPPVTTVLTRIGAYPASEKR